MRILESLFGPDINSLQKKRDVEGLIKALDHKRMAKRRDAAVALGELRDSRAVGPLIKALQDQEWDVRRAAARALGELGDPRAVEPLINALKERDLAGRALVHERVTSPSAGRVCEVVQQSGPYLREASAREHNFQIAAATALGMLRDPRAVDPLIATLKRKMRLRQLCSTFMRSPRIDAKDVIEALQDEPEIVRIALGVILTSTITNLLGRIEADIFLFAKLDQKEVESFLNLLPPSPHESPRSPLASLIWGLNYGELMDYEVEKALLSALGELGDPRAVEPLQAAVKNEDLRETASRALTKLQARSRSE